MDIRLGYKQTEVGIIPQDWVIMPLGSLLISSPKNGYSGASGRDARGTLTLSLSATTTGQSIIGPETTKRLYEQIDAKSDLYLRPGDILVQRSNTLELVGTTALFDGQPGIYIYPDLMIRLRFCSDSTAIWFWKYANSRNGRRYFVSVASGSSGSMPKITGAKLKMMPVPLPPLPEQRAIAEALGDVDALLLGLDRLIAKKRDLKQAAMQQLLTGKTRLPGFSGEWTPRAISQISRRIIDHRGRTPLKLGMEWGNGDIPALSARNVKMGRIDFSEETYFGSEQLYRRWMGHDHARKGDLVITTEAPLGNVALIPDGRMYILSQRAILLQVDPSIASTRFLLQLMMGNQFQRTLLENASGSTATGIQRRRFERLELGMPSISEQVAIAEVLGDMDAELMALEARRDKTWLLKQGMMQELLTGRTRLV